MRQKRLVTGQSKGQMEFVSETTSARKNTLAIVESSRRRERKFAKGKQPVMEGRTIRDVKLPVYVDISYTTRFYGAHKFHELFQLIENGKWLRDDEELNEREE
jgi:hypothetical protein